MNYFLFNFLFWQNNQPVPTVGWLDIVWLLVQTAIALALVCGFAILIFKYILPRLSVVSFNKSIVHVVDGTSLDARKRLLVVEVAGKYLLLASSENGVQLISELDGPAVEQAVAAAEKSQKESKKDSFMQILDGFRKKRG
ncbi:MAG: flagellar biosynthetic protein FliO [Actinomycetota bacterium]